MKKDNLKNVLRQHLEKKSLSEKQLDSLLQLQTKKTGQDTTETKKSYHWVAFAAVFFIAISNVFYFGLTSRLAMDKRIGSEVAKNHIKLKPLEIQTSSIQVIRNYFTELDFSPVESALLGASTKRLIGGRYCSIQGITAAQLRLKDDKTGQVQSLYQTVYDKKIFSDLPELEDNQKPVTVYSKGLAVDIWVEKGLLFALTRETNSKNKD